MYVSSQQSLNAKFVWMYFPNNKWDIFSEFYLLVLLYNKNRSFHFIHKLRYDFHFLEKVGKPENNNTLIIIQ